MTAQLRLRGLRISQQNECRLLSVVLKVGMSVGRFEARRHELTDEPWALIEPLLVPAPWVGR